MPLIFLNDNFNRADSFSLGNGFEQTTESTTGIAIASNTLKFNVDDSTDIRLCFNNERLLNQGLLLTTTWAATGGFSGTQLTAIVLPWTYNESSNGYGFWIRRTTMGIASIDWLSGNLQLEETTVSLGFNRYSTYVTVCFDNKMIVFGVATSPVFLLNQTFPEVTGFQDTFVGLGGTRTAASGTARIQCTNFIAQSLARRSYKTRKLL